MDDIEPDCDNCPVPPLDEPAVRALTMHALLDRFEGLGIGSDVLRMYGATKDDLELLAVVDHELRSQCPDNRKGQHQGQ